MAHWQTRAADFSVVAVAVLGVHVLFSILTRERREGKRTKISEQTKQRTNSKLPPTAFWFCCSAPPPRTFQNGLPQWWGQAPKPCKVGACFAAETWYFLMGRVFPCAREFLRGGKGCAAWICSFSRKSWQHVVYYLVDLFKAVCDDKGRRSKAASWPAGERGT